MKKLLPFAWLGLLGLAVFTSCSTPNVSSTAGPKDTSGAPVATTTQARPPRLMNGTVSTGLYGDAGAYFAP